MQFNCFGLVWFGLAQGVNKVYLLVSSDHKTLLSFNAYIKHLDVPTS